MSRGKSSPQFKLEHDREIFSTADEREAFGFTPFDLFVTDEVPEDGVLDPRTVFYGADGGELIEDIEDDMLLVCRYKNTEFDMENNAGVPWDAEAYPALQREFQPASVDVDDNFRGLLQIIDDGFEGFDTEYMYKFAVKEGGLKLSEGAVNRFTDVENYLDHISNGPVTVWPEVFGINSVSVHPQSFTAILDLYQQEVTAQRDDYEMREHGIGGNDEYWETVELNYDEDPVEALEASLERQGFETKRNYLPPSVVPEEIR